MTWFMPGGDDLPFHLNRIEAIKTALSQGQFPNRLSSWWYDGYGYASAVFYGELFLYVPALLRILGFSVQAAYKFYVVAVNLATAVIAYRCFGRIFKSGRAGLFGCIFYMLAPYRLVCIFLRGAVGEYTAMAFFPLIFYGMFQIYAKDPKESKASGWLAVALGYTGLLQSHILSCVMAGIFTGLCCLVFLKRTLQPARIWQLVKAGATAVLLNLWFLVPFLDYFRLGYTGSTGDSNPLGRFNSNGAFFSQMLSLFQTGSGASYSVDESFLFPGERNYALGGFLLIFVFYVCYRVYRGKNKSAAARMGDVSLGFALVSMLMCTVWFPWDWIQQSNGLFRMITRNIQLPWRFLGVSCLFLTVTGISLLVLLEKEKQRQVYSAAVVILCSFFVLSAGYFLSDYTQSAPLYRYLDENDLDSASVGLGEYLPSDTPEGFYAETAVVCGEGLELTSEERSGETYRICCANPSDSDAWADLPLLPYRGYAAVDERTGEQLEILTDVPGKVRVLVPAGYSGSFAVEYREPWYWRASELVSLLFWAAGVCGCAGQKFGKCRARDARPARRP